MTVARGTRVRIIYPTYAADRWGYVRGREERAGRWLVQLSDRDGSMLLSLERTDFEVEPVPDKERAA